jgi:hypothetical protein
VRAGAAAAATRLRGPLLLAPAAVRWPPLPMALPLPPSCAALGRCSGAVGRPVAAISGRLGDRSGTSLVSGAALPPGPPAGRGSWSRRASACSTRPAGCSGWPAGWVHPAVQAGQLPVLPARCCESSAAARLSYARLALQPRRRSG